jgi:hypothetical protein
MNLKEYQTLVSRLEEEQRQQDRDEGALSQLLAQLEEKFGVDTLERGRKLLTKKEKDIASKEKELQSLLEEYQSKWEARRE